MHPSLDAWPGSQYQTTRTKVIPEIQYWFGYWDRDPGNSDENAYPLPEAGVGAEGVIGFEGGVIGRDELEELFNNGFNGGYSRRVFESVDRMVRVKFAPAVRRTSKEGK